MNRKIYTLKSLSAWQTLHFLPFGLIIVTLLLAPLYYHQRLISGIFNTDIYLTWFTGCTCWIWVSFQNKIPLTKLTITTVLGCLYFLTLCLVKSFPDQNSINAFITLVSYIGILKYMKQVAHAKYAWMLTAGILAAFLIQLCKGLWQWYTNNQQALLIQGDFFNSGSFANYIAAVIPLLLSGTINKAPINKYLRLLFAVLFIITSVLLFFTIARSAIIGSTVGCLLVIFMNTKIENHRKWLWFSVAALAFMAIATAALYKLKPASASGRLTIYKVSINIIKDQPLTGVGPNRFAAVYNHYQSAYFQKQKTDVATQLLAENMMEAYNSILQVLAEYGLIGLSILLLILHLLIKKSVANPPVRYETWLYRGSVGCLVSIIICSFFSNPFHLSPIVLLIVYYLSIVLPATKSVPVLHWKNHLLLIPVIMLGTSTCFYALQLSGAEKKWQTASELAKLNEFENARNFYAAAYPFLQYNGDFLFNYGAEACIAGEFTLTIELLEKAKRYNSINHILIYLGDAYTATNQFRLAEKNYIAAIYTTPAHIYPKYRLIQLYKKWGKPALANEWTTKTLQYPVKIKSEITDNLIKKLREEN